MPYPHAIRLRGPWEYEPLARTVLLADGTSREEPGELPPAGRVRLPADWGATLGESFRGRVRYRRRFNRPSGMDPHERLWLVIEGVDAWATVALNGRMLGRVAGYAAPASFDVTELVEPSNELLLEVELPRAEPGAPPARGGLRPGRENLPGGPVGEVRLEVRAAHFIEQLAIESGPARVTVSGRIEGEPVSRPLAITLSGPDGEIAYGEARPGESFSLSAALDLLTGRPPKPGTTMPMPLVVKLIDGGTCVWEKRIDPPWSPGRT